ncbi:MAG: ion transporter [Phycisphaeraceae bacterium]
MTQSSKELVKQMNWSRLKQIIERTDTRGGRVFDWSVQALILLSIVTFSIETLPGLSQKTQRTLHYLEYIVVALFTIEYLLRAYVATPRWKYCVGFWGLVDLAAIVPSYLALGIDLRVIRSLRLLRLFRLLKLARYSQAVKRYSIAFYSIRAELTVFLSTMLILIYLSAVGIYYFERDAQPDHFSSVFDSLWWAIITLTTVGYGDIYPTTVGGRVFTSIILILGLGIVAVPSGLIAAALTQAIKNPSD